MAMRMVGRYWGLAVVVVMVMLAVAGLGAQAAEPAVAQLRVTVTDESYAIRPQVAPGRYELVIENLSAQDIALELVRAPYAGTAERPHLDGQAGVVVFAGSAEAYGQGDQTVDLVAGDWIVRDAQTDAYMTAFSVSPAK